MRGLRPRGFFLSFFLVFLLLLSLFFFSFVHIMETEKKVKDAEALQDKEVPPTIENHHEEEEDEDEDDEDGEDNEQGLSWPTL